jgi:hypothetical protein
MKTFTVNASKRIILLIMVLLPTLISACGTAMASPTAAPMTPTPTNQLLGHWTKLETGTEVPATQVAGVVIVDSCDLAYPPTVEFLNDGTYKGDPTSLIANVFEWPGGTYQLLDAHKVEVQTKDGLGDYEVAFDADIMTIVDNTGCQIKYQHSQ